MDNIDEPRILIEGQYTRTELDDLKRQKIWKIKDIYKSQLTELFEIQNARLVDTPDFSDRLAEFIAERSEPEYDLRGNYVYYPWSGLLLHTVSEAEEGLLRTNRTRSLLTPEEQQKMSSFTAGVAGLSFGNGIVLSLVYAGAAAAIKIADNDIFETTNLNRVRVGLPSVGELKTAVTAREVYEINPYANVKVFSEGLTEESLDSFINSDPKLNVIFDVVDDFSMKVRIRMAAREAKIPVIMLTSLEDSVLVDVERFDLNPEAEIFHGLLESVKDDLLTKKMSEQDKARYAMAIVGQNNISYRNLLSLSQIGTDLVSRPHLFGTVSIVCGLATYIVKRIALGEDMPSMRKLLQFHETLGLMPNRADTPEAREALLSKLLQSRSD